jgi:hypothetical protein
MPQVSCQSRRLAYAGLIARSTFSPAGAAMAHESPLVRQWILLRALSARPCRVTIKELVDELGVSEKTIRRDLETFCTAGFPLQETIEQFGRKK